MINKLSLLKCYKNTKNNKTVTVVSKLHYWGTECNLYDSLLETKGRKLSCQVLPELFPQRSYFYV